VWATKILPLSLNGVPDHILQFGCRRQMEDFHTVCRSKLCFCRLPNSPVAWSTLLKGLVFKKEPSNLLSCYVHFQIQHASCFKNLVWPSKETCTSNPSWLRKFNQIEGHDNSWKGRQLKYWWLHISIQSGSRYIKLLPFLFLFQGLHLIFEVHNLLPKLYKPMTCEIAFHIMINILLMYIYGIFQTVHKGKATLNNLTCKWNFQLFTYFKKECFIGAI